MVISMVRVKCKKCGQILIDTEAGIGNIAIESELGFDEEWRMKWEGEKWAVCTNCGHRIELEKLRRVIGNG